ncbi:putative protein T-ENOL isoform X2 [Fukomys damarensis]|uniref:putative protein T-ENOL isoform X2 n=1 Tax=Fukomys damarensis TaxID=885580 RepID=UPI00053F6C46|nr:putative protein T-ENOL isoform X2 [Fukomys damarensis]
MASTPIKKEENSRPPEAALTLIGGRIAPAALGPVRLSPSQKASVSRSEESLTQISTELTEEAMLIACCHVYPEPLKQKQTKDQGTQISKHAFFSKTQGTDTRSDRNWTRTKAHLPSPLEKTMPSNAPCKATS